MLNDTRPLYSIGMAAELLNVHPRTLRLYEQGGLLRPARRNNRRVYSNNDLKWIKSIRYLIHERGLNQEGLRRLLALIPCWEITNCCEVYVLRFTLTQHSYDVLGLALNPEGEVLASASSDQTIRLWDVETGARLKILRGHTGEITGVTFLLDGCLLASSSRDNSVRLWGAPSKVLTSTATPVSTSLIDLEPITGANARKLREVGILQHNKVGKIATSLDGRRLAVQSGQRIYLYAMEKTSLLEQSQPATCLALSPEAETLATGDRDGNIYLWDSESGLQLHILEGHTGQLNSLAFSPEGLKLASGDDKTVQLWEFTTGRRIVTFGPLGGVVKSVVFSPDGKLIAAIDSIGAIKLWDVENGTLVHELEEKDAGEFANHSFVFSPDGRLLVIEGSDSKTCPAYLNKSDPCWQIAGETCDQSKACSQCEVYLSARERICQKEELETIAAFEI
ncbi:MAG: MerR family transcriptional regulator [Anaerolineales bacterium]|nr:MAG: MerR family transcriptional regulator [Anaerolineales bacterium]